MASRLRAAPRPLSRAPGRSRRRLQRQRPCGAAVQSQAAPAPAPPAPPPARSGDAVARIALSLAALRLAPSEGAAAEWDAAARAALGSEAVDAWRVTAAGQAGQMALVAKQQAHEGDELMVRACVRACVRVCACARDGKDVAAASQPFARRNMATTWQAVCHFLLIRQSIPSAPIAHPLGCA